MARIWLTTPPVNFMVEARTDLDLGSEDEVHLREIAGDLEHIVATLASDIVARLEARHVSMSYERCVSWLRSGLRGPWDERFYADRVSRSRDMVASAVPSTTIVGVLHAVRMTYLAHLLAQNASPKQLQAIHKLVDLELAILLRTYCQADQRAAMQTLSIGFAHELRNPLNSAKLQFDVLERRLRRLVADPAIAEPAALARQEIERLCALVEDFLVYAQPPPLTAVMCDLVMIAEYVVELEQAYAQERGVQLVLERPTTRWHARVDSDKVRHAIKNLVRNAVEAAPPGGHVVVRVTGEADRVHLVISDDGPGISDKVRARMFEPFFSTKDAGTGLGMSIVQSIVAMHDGRIDVASTPAGTLFDVTLPRAS